MYKFYLSYWSGGYVTQFNKSKKPSQLLFLMNKLCAYLIKKHYGRVILLTDDYGKQYLENCGFDSIETETLNQLNDDLSDDFTQNWAIGKLYVYRELAKRNEPFLHVDYDVFLFNPLPEYALNQQVLVQSKEDSHFFSGLSNAKTNYGLDIFEQYVEHRHEFPKIIDDSFCSYNVGVFGGTNLKFIESYANKAIKFTFDKKTKKLYRALFQRNKALPATFTEQYYLGVLAKKYNVPVTSLVPGQNLSEISKNATAMGFVHLCEQKHDPATKQRIKQMCEEIDILNERKKQKNAKVFQNEWRRFYSKICNTTVRVL